MSKNVIYCLIDPLTNQIKYIGQTIKNYKIRFREHISLCNLKYDNSHKANWIKKLLKLKLKPEIYIIEYCESSLDLNEAEEFYISYFKSIGCNLTNSCNGGKGTFGYKHKEKTKEIISKKAKERDQSHLKQYQIKKQNKIINGVECRECFDCKKFIDLKKYSITKKGIYYSYCKKCSASRKRENRKINPDRLKYVKLSEEEYKKSRINASRKGGEAVANNPELICQISERNSKSVIAIHRQTGEILEFKSAILAINFGFNNKCISNAIRNKQSYKNYMWKFKKK